MFAITSGRGFLITLPNGYTLSVQFGPGNYCEHCNVPDPYAPLYVSKWSSKDAEIGIYNPKGDLIPFLESDQHSIVKGYASASDFASLVEYVSKL